MKKLQALLDLQEQKESKDFRLFTKEQMDESLDFIKKILKKVVLLQKKTKNLKI